MGLLAKINAKVKKQKHTVPWRRWAQLDTRDSPGDYLEAARYDSELGRLLDDRTGGTSYAAMQQQQYQRYLAQAQIFPLFPLSAFPQAACIPASGICQPSRQPVGKKHVDCSVIEPKGLPAPAPIERRK